jgi:hypothetical protein
LHFFAPWQINRRGGDTNGRIGHFLQQQAECAGLDCRIAVQEKHVLGGRSPDSKVVATSEAEVLLRDEDVRFRPSELLSEPSGRVVSGAVFDDEDRARSQAAESSPEPFSTTRTAFVSRSSITDCAASNVSSFVLKLTMIVSTLPLNTPSYVCS